MAKNNHLKLYVIMGTGILLLIIFVAVMVWSGQSASTKPDSQAVQGASVQNTTKSLPSDYFTTVVDSLLVIKSQNLQAHGNILRQLFLASNSSRLGDPQTDQLAITIGLLPADGLAGIADIQLRQHNPADYQLQPEAGYIAGAKVFIKNTDNYEIAVFWPHGVNYAAVVISSTVDRAGLLASQLKTVLTNWQWLK